jgi:hypothetical protein
LEPTLNTKNLNQLVTDCLNCHWLGYGNLDAEVWIVAQEEGGAEISENRHPRRTPGQNYDERLISSLKERINYAPSMDFRNVWIDRYNYDEDELGQFIRSGTIWRYISAFMLFWEDESMRIAHAPHDQRREMITNYIKSNHFSNFLSRESNIFLCEFSPLPMRRHNEIPPEFLAALPVNSISEYRKEISRVRFRLIYEQFFEDKNAQVLVTFDKHFFEVLKSESANYYSDFILRANENKRYEALEKKETKTPILLKTPFFGRGLSYEGLFSVEEEILTHAKSMERSNIK